MFKKIILLLFISSFVISGFAQKNKRKTNLQSPKSNYFAMLINGDTIQAERYCPFDTIIFDFFVKDSSIMNFFKSYSWRESYHLGSGSIDNTRPVKFVFPTLYPDESIFTITLTFFEPTHGNTHVLTAKIEVDYARTILDTTVCEGGDISVINSFGDTLTFTNVRIPPIIPWDTLASASGCDSLVRWEITMIPYIREFYEVTSCDSVIWGDTLIKRPPDFVGDYETIVERVFLSNDPNIPCSDTLKILTVTIIDTAILKLHFDQKAFCAGDDPMGFIILETNFTAFNWTVNWDKYRAKDRDSTFTEFETELPVEYSGYYRVQAYMDTSLFETLADLRIMNRCSDEDVYRDTLIADCPLIIPNVITPNDDGKNDVFGIKKLNPERENELVIYDRWGKNVFSQKNYKCVFKNLEYYNVEDAFKGLARGGRKLPDGTYYYAFIYDAIPKLIKYTGTLVILRD